MSHFGKLLKRLRTEKGLAATNKPTTDAKATLRRRRHESESAAGLLRTPEQNERSE